MKIKNEKQKIKILFCISIYPQTYPYTHRQVNISIHRMPPYIHRPIYKPLQAVLPIYPSIYTSISHSASQGILTGLVGLSIHGYMGQGGFLHYIYRHIDRTAGQRATGNGQGFRVCLYLACKAPQGAEGGRGTDGRARGFGGLAGLQRACMCMCTMCMCMICMIIYICMSTI